MSDLTTAIVIALLVTAIVLAFIGFSKIGWVLPTSWQDVKKAGPLGGMAILLFFVATSIVGGSIRSNRKLKAADKAEDEYNKNREKFVLRVDALGREIQKEAEVAKSSEIEANAAEERAVEHVIVADEHRSLADAAGTRADSAMERANAIRKLHESGE